MEKCKMAPCGLDCDGCNIFRSSFDIAAAESLVKWFKSQGWIGEKEGAIELMKKGPFCNGCQGDRSVLWSDNCSILTCCVDDKKLDTCSECDNFPCNNLEKWADDGEHHRIALSVLKQQKKNPF